MRCSDCTTSALTCALLLCSTAVAANDTSISIGIGASATQGVGVDVGYDLSQRLTLRASYYRYTHNRHDEIDNLAFDLDLALQNSGAFLDYHPWASHHDGFRITAGLLHNGNEINATGQPDNGTYTLGETTYTAAQVGALKAEVGFRSTAPYIGIGYDYAPSTNLRLTTDVGLIYQDSPDISYTASGILATDPGFQADLAQEEQEARDDLSDFRYLPVLKVAVSYRF